MAQLLQTRILIDHASDYSVEPVSYTHLHQVEGIRYDCVHAGSVGGGQPFRYCCSG